MSGNSCFTRCNIAGGLTFVERSVVFSKFDGELVVENNCFGPFFWLVFYRGPHECMKLTKTIRSEEIFIVDSFQLVLM